jgi:hypothetical protein
LKVLFPDDSPEHCYLRSLGEIVLGRPHGVPVDGTPFSVDFGMVNKCEAASLYKRETFKSPAALLQDVYQAYFIRTKTPRTVILSFTSAVLDYLLGHTDVPPGGLCGTGDLPGSYCLDGGAGSNTDAVCVTLC